MTAPAADETAQEWRRRDLIAACNEFLAAERAADLLLDLWRRESAEVTRAYLDSAPPGRRHDGDQWWVGPRLLGEAVEAAVRRIHAAWWTIRELAPIILGEDARAWVCSHATLLLPPTWTPDPATGSTSRRPA